MEGVLTALVIFVLCPAVILGFILLSRYLKYRETLTMIQHGITPPPPPAPAPYPMPGPVVPPRTVVVNQGGAGRGTLIWGVVLSGIGLGLTLALWPIGFIANNASGNSVNFPLGLGPWMVAGFIPLFVGLALVLAWVLMRTERGTMQTMQMMPPIPPTPEGPGANGAPYGAYPAQAAPGAESGVVHNSEPPPSAPTA